VICATARRGAPFAAVQCRSSVAAKARARCAQKIQRSAAACAAMKTFTQEASLTLPRQPAARHAFYAMLRMSAPSPVLRLFTPCRRHVDVARHAARAGLRATLAGAALFCRCYATRSERRFTPGARHQLFCKRTMIDALCRVCRCASAMIRR